MNLCSEISFSTNLALTLPTPGIDQRGPSHRDRMGTPSLNSRLKLPHFFIAFFSLVFHY